MLVQSIVLLVIVHAWRNWHVKIIDTQISLKLPIIEQEKPLYVNTVL